MFGSEDLDHESSWADFFHAFMNVDFCILMLIIERNTHDGSSGIKLWWVVDECAFLEITLIAKLNEELLTLQCFQMHANESLVFIYLAF